VHTPLLLSASDDDDADAMWSLVRSLTSFGWLEACGGLIMDEPIREASRTVPFMPTPFWDM
jgi:hypothetical protein